MSGSSDAPHPVRVLEAAPGRATAQLAARLRERGIPHRMFEEQGRVVVIAGAHQAAAIRELYATLERQVWRGEGEAAEVAWVSSDVLSALRAAPGTVAWGLPAALVYLGLVSGLLSPELFWFVPRDAVSEDPGSIAQSIVRGELWRFWSPTLLHFSLVHVAFNLLWLWLFGRRIEWVYGGRGLAALILITGIAANCCQFFLRPEAPWFGGYSGVVYGLLGFLMWVGSRNADPRLQLPPGAAAVLIGMMVIFSVGILDPILGLAQMGIANGAHWGGFVAGIVAAMLADLRRGATA